MIRPIRRELPTPMQSVWPTARPSEHRRSSVLHRAAAARSKNFVQCNISYGDTIATRVVTSSPFVGVSSLDLGRPARAASFSTAWRQGDDMHRTSRIALVLGGGNALGAYHAGAYEHLHQNGIRPDWIVGASIGAVMGAILAGNALRSVSTSSTNSGPSRWSTRRDR